MAEPNGRRELGMLGAKIDNLEIEVEKLRFAKHDHANKIVALAHVPAVLRDITDRVDKVESWRDRLLGMAAIVSVLGGLIGSYVMQRIFGP